MSLPCDSLYEGNGCTVSLRSIVFTNRNKNARNTTKHLLERVRKQTFTVKLFNRCLAEHKIPIKNFNVALNEEQNEQLT